MKTYQRLKNIKRKRTRDQKILRENVPETKKYQEKTYQRPKNIKRKRTREQKILRENVPETKKY